MHYHLDLCNSRNSRLTVLIRTIIVCVMEESSVEMLASALIYLMTHYARTGCPRLALCVARHLQSLALHPRATAALRDTCAGLHGGVGQCFAQRIARGLPCTDLGTTWARWFL